jgi:hypothetical protein
MISKILTDITRDVNQNFFQAELQDHAGKP